MDIETHQTHRTTIGSPTQRFVAQRLLACLLAVTSLGVGFTVRTTTNGDEREAGVSEPDIVADHRGGTAARLHDADGTPIAGDVFLLIGSANPTASARVYDATPYTHDGRSHPDTVRSNLLALTAVNAIADSDIGFIAMTSGSGGGPSGGLTRAIAYLNVLSDGEFTGDLRVAATGELSPEGHVGAIEHIDEKTAAAHLAGADVLFTPTVPTAEALEVFAARTVGESVRDPLTGDSLHDPRRVDLFRRWGTSRPPGMDVVDARHLIDVSSYLCGAGSAFACDITDRLVAGAQQRLDELTDEASTEVDRFRAINRQSAAHP